MDDIKKVLINKENINLELREITENEIDQIWNIDRTEYVESIYIKKDGILEEKSLQKTFYGWPPNEEKIYGPVLKDCYKRGGYFLAGFKNDKLKAIVILESKWIGKNADTLQLKFLHIDKAFRRRGIGTVLFKKAQQKAKELKAGRIYISATENKNTVEFYKSMGCKVTEDIDQELYQFEPNDIHMDLIL
ncbi:MAG: GNAT family N-acetyltransferase [Spirochaetaceae bacterium]